MKANNTRGKAQPGRKILPSEVPLLKIRPALLDDFGLKAGSGIHAKAVEESKAAMRLKRDLHPFPSHDHLKVNTALAHITNAVVLAIGSPNGRIWLERNCACRGEDKRTSTSFLLLAFKAYGPYDRSINKRRQSDKTASDDARAMLNALALERKLPLQIAKGVFSIPGKSRSSFYRTK